MSLDADRILSRRGLGLIGAALMLTGIGAALAVWWPDIAFQAGMIRIEAPYPTRVSPSDLGTRAGAATPKGDRLVIPRLAVDAPVFEGRANTALAKGVYHYPETADPGEPGNAVIAGHRVRRAFTLLYRLRRGDIVIVYWRGREYDYRVARLFEVAPTATDILDRGDVERLTLYTCEPRTFGDRRTVVVAEPVRP